MWTHRIWNFSGFSARIFRWSQDFSPDVEPSVAPVWLSLPQLPLYLFNKETLFAIASLVGNPPKVDRATASVDKLLRPSIARVLVELDVLKERPNQVWVGSQERGQWQTIEMEAIPAYCTNCCKLGHSNNQCNPQIFRKDVTSERIRKGRKKVWILIIKGNNANQVPKKVNPRKDKMDDPQLTIASNDKMALMTASPGLATLNRNEVEPSHVTCQNRNGKINVHPAAVTFPSSSGDQTLAVTPRLPLIREENNLGQFLFNLGQFLDLIKRQEGKAADSDESPLAIDPLKEAPKDSLNIEPVTSKKPNTEAINVTISWEEDEPSSIYKVSSMTDLAILKAIPTIMWDEEQCSNMLKVRSTSELASLHDFPIDSESEEDGEDRWTENSFEEDPQDKLDDFLDKIDKGKKPSKQTKYMDALVSPKANVASGRKLRERNPFICYSEGKRWNFR